MQKNDATEIMVISVRFYFDSSELSKIFSKRMEGLLQKKEGGFSTKILVSKCFKFSRNIQICMQIIC